MTETDDKQMPVTGEDYAFEATASFAQQRLWFLDQLEPGSAAYNINFAIRLQGELNLTALQQALDALVARHESLRTTFDTADDVPVQVIAEQQQIPFEIHPVTDATAERAKLNELAGHSFDLRKGPLLRPHIIQSGSNEQVLLLVIHHAIADAWSLQILYGELSTTYAAIVNGDQLELPDLEIQYADYAEWQQDWLSDDELQKQLDYWVGSLGNCAPTLNLPTDKPRPRTQTSNGANATLELDKELTAGLKSLAQNSSTTLFNLALAVFEVLLARYSGSEDIVVGTPVAGRKRPELQNLIGFFVNTIALHSDLSGDPAFRKLLEQVKKDSLNALSNDDLPFERLVEELRPNRDISYSPIFQVMFVLHHGGSGEASFGELTAEGVTVNSGTAKFDLTLFVTEADENLSLLFEYNTDLFEATTIERMLGHYESLLRAVVANPDAKLSELPLLNAAERTVVVEDFNTTDMTFDAVCVHRMVEAQVAKTPTAVAVELGEVQLTYSELNNRANSLATQLRAQGAAAGKIVAVSLPRTLNLPVALLAVMKSGACYVPVDPNYPADRIQAMLDDSAAEIVLDEAYLSGFNFSGPVDNFDGGDIPDDINSPLYCIYTSGSTGKPKGVQLSHAGLGNLLNWQNQHERLSVPAKTLQFASFSFDVHFQEFFGTWSNGGTTVMVDEELRQDLPRLAAFIDAQNIERLFLPYAALQPIAETLVANNASPALKDIVVAGEQLQVSPEVRGLFGLLNNAALHNQYGPSEAHVVTALTLTGNEQEWPALPSIGTPVANTHCYVLDQSGTPCPIGIPGELYLGGIQVGIGYLNRHELNAEKFSSSPFISAERLYRTGDRVRFLSDGAIEFLGRADDQVKWRGFRIEPGEIEARLTDQPTVQQAIVLLREDTPGDKRLVAYVTGDNPDESQLRQALKESLPDYMVPGLIVVLDELPLTPSGKVARRRLPTPEYSRDDSQPYVAPRNDSEQTLTELWGEVLKLEQVGIHDDFFQLGGHSLLATQLISRIRAKLDTEVPLIDLFSNPTVADFAVLLNGAAATTSLPPIVARNSNEPAPLSFSQQRLWFLDQLDPGNPVYNFPVVLNFKGPLNTTAMQAALNDLIARHESLRTCFTTNANEAEQVILPAATIELTHEDCSQQSTDQVRQSIDRLVQQGFDLGKAPLLRAVLLQQSDVEHTLVLSTHHIVSDGWSLGIMMRDLGCFYTARSHDQEHQTADLTVQYSDYAVWQRDWFSGDELQRQLDYWRTDLQDAPPVIDLPTDRPRPAEQSFNGSSLLRYLPGKLATELEQLASAANCTPYMVLLATFDVLLARYSGNDEIVVGSPIAGRRLTELEDLIGFFSNTLAIRGDLSGDPSFNELLARTRASTLGAYAHQDLPFEKLVEELQPERDMSHSPVFQVMLVMQNNPEEALQFDTLDVSYPEFEMGIAKFELLLEVAMSADGLRTGMQYNTDLFEAATIERMLGHFETLLKAVVANPAAKLSELPLLDAGESKVVVEDFNATDMTFDAVCVHRMVEAQVAISPTAVAVELGDQQLTYSELNNRANALATHLRAQGAAAGKIVAVSLPRTLDLPVALLAVMKSGACYVPVDPNYPADRIQAMLDDSAAEIVLDEAYLSAFDFSGPADNLDGGDISNPLYCIYTSGSTGKPKGVQLSHAGLGNLLNWQNQHERLSVPAKTLQFASFSFDVHFQEFFGTWSNGGTTVMVDEDLRQDLARLADFIDAQSIERLFLPYAALQPIAETLVANKASPALRDIIVAGEQLQVSPEVRGLFGLLNNAALHNQYGPSEAHVVTALTLTGNEQDWPALPSIGTPVANTRCYVLDQSGTPCPIGIPGVLYLGGVQVAIGYLNRPKLKA
jgi:amino acid adenylation domain-containing protein